MRTSPTVQRRDAVPTPAPTPTAPVTPPHQPPEAATPPPAASRTARTSSQTRDSGAQKRTTTSAATQTAAFDARALTEGQFDELVHRLIGPLTRLLRTEFRLDRERIGKLRDPRR